MKRDPLRKNLEHCSKKYMNGMMSRMASNEEIKDEHSDERGHVYGLRRELSSTITGRSDGSGLPAHTRSGGGENVGNM
jgi:hypothetical protein